MGADPVNEPVAWLAMMLKVAAGEMAAGGEFAVLIVTARHEPYREMTEKWLNDNGIAYDRLYMRGDDDRRPDHKVKADILAQILDDGYDPFLVIDDRPEVCVMWRSYGLTVLECAYEDTRSRLAGQHLLTLLVGPAGAGKTTYVAKNYREGEVISTDRIREQEGLGHEPEDLAKTFRLARAMARARVENGFHAVIDATNLKQKDRLSFVEAMPKDILVHYVLLDRDYDEKVRDRGWRPIELIDKHHRMFRDTTLPQVKDADGLGNVVVVDKRQKK